MRDVSINSTKATGLYKHNNFERGEAPKAFIVRKPCGFCADDAIREEFLQIRDAIAEPKGSRLNFLWAMKLDEKRRLIPAGLALINPKQIIVKLGSPVNLFADDTA